MATELDVLALVSDRLSAGGIEFMLTGSFALAYYATPRMTRDLDLVIALDERDVDALVAAFSGDFYVDADAARTAIRAERLFNLLHLDSGIKVDLIIRKSSAYRRLEFSRRQPVVVAGVRTWIVSCEDLILSKLAWALESGSELQQRDVRLPLAEPVELARLYSIVGSATRRCDAARAIAHMNDTPAHVARMVAARHRAMGPAGRWLAAASMFESARAIIEASLPPNLPADARRLAVARRFYATELPAAALAAHARHGLRRP